MVPQRTIQFKEEQELPRIAATLKISHMLPRVMSSNLKAEEVRLEFYAISQHQKGYNPSRFGNAVAQVATTQDDLAPEEQLNTSINCLDQLTHPEVRKGKDDSLLLFPHDFSVFLLA